MCCTAFQPTKDMLRRFTASIYNSLETHTAQTKENQETISCEIKEDDQEQIITLYDDEIIQSISFTL